MVAVADILDRFHSAKAARAPMDTVFEDIAAIQRPSRSGFSVERLEGTPDTDRIFDSTPQQAGNALAAHIDGMMKPRDEKWFFVEPEDPALEDHDDILAWTQEVEARMMTAIYRPQARFLQQSGQVDRDLVFFNTGVLFIGAHLGEGRLQFQAHALKQTYLLEGADSAIDTVFRILPFTARQAVQVFGADAVGRQTREALGRGAEQDRRRAYLHAVLPRADFDPRRRDALQMPYASIYIDLESEHLISEGGFRMFPFAVPRWETESGEIYGQGPGHLAQPDACTLQQMGKTLLEAGHLAVDPPILAPHQGFMSAPRTFPGGISYYDPSVVTEIGAGAIRPFETGKNLPLGYEAQRQQREMVWAAYFRSVLNLPTGGPRMTATEIIERREEMVRVMGPIFARLETDYTAHIVQRVFDILLTNGAFPPPPPVLRGQSVKFRYRSPLKRIHELIDNAALRAYVDEIAPLARADASILDHLDLDEIARGLFRRRGLPAKWLRAREDVAALRAERQQRQALEEAGDLVERTVDIAKTLSEIEEG
ncbi:MAG: portal protein [Alphaproteobacteria bacterium]